jgi:nitrite reductase (NADH) large subunit
MPGLAREGRERLVVVGGGMAGLRLVEELTALCPGRYDIVMIAGERRRPYNRVLLSAVLAGDASDGDIELRPSSWYRDNGVELVSGVTATSLHTTEPEVTLSTGARVSFDRLVLATGSQSIRLPIPGNALAGVIAFRDLDDVRAMQAMRPGAQVAVIGGGLLGIEAAYGLARRGCKVVLVHIMARLMERQLDARGAQLVQAAIEGMGIDVMLEAQAEAIEGQGRAERVVLKDGRVIPAELVVMAAGIRPNTELAHTGGLETGRGINVDADFETSRRGIYAVGECAEHRGVCCGLVEPAYAQAGVLARRLAGLPARYEPTAASASLKVSGVPVFSIGDFEGRGAETVLLEDAGAGTYRKLVLRNGLLAGAVLVGDTAEAAWYRELISAGTAVAPLRSALAFGKAFAEAA